MMKNILIRFQEKFSKGEDTVCWLWSAGLSAKGYGVFWNGEKHVNAHRFAWSLANGDIPAEMHVLHKCDVRSCVNPSHLFIGTNADNMADKMAKGRYVAGFKPSGEANKNSRLTVREVIEIRRLISHGLPATKICEGFGVSATTVRNIRANKIWRAAV